MSQFGGNYYDDTYMDSDGDGLLKGEENGEEAAFGTDPSNYDTTEMA